jgi:hypothetical protein
MTADRTPRNTPSRRWQIEDNMSPLNTSKGRAKKSTPAKPTTVGKPKKRRTKKEMAEERRIKELVERVVRGIMDSYYLEYFD